MHVNPSIISHAIVGPFPLLFSCQIPTQFQVSTISMYISLLYHLLLSFSSTTMVLVLIRLFLLLLLCNGSHCFEEKKVLSLQKHYLMSWKQNQKQSGGVIPSCHFHKSRNENGATILEMKHRDHCSEEITSDNINKKLKKRLIIDDLRVQSLQLQIKTKLSGSEIPITSGIKLDTLDYTVQIGLGAQNMTVIVDTGSDLTWVQCQPCQQCYTQKEPILNPTMSPSYHPLLCNSSACQSFASGRSQSCATQDHPLISTCSYAMSYGDGSYTRGDLGSERLSLGTTVVDSFVFGCGRVNRGLFGGASGLLGLGKSRVSLVSQTYAMFGGVFSYCLPSKEPSNSGSLVLGENPSLYKNFTPILYTKIITHPQLSSFYFINFTGITIGNVSLRTTSFSMIIDSGTVVTRLPPSVYSAAKKAFLKYFDSYPSSPGYSILDTCFNLSGYQEVNIPIIRIHFDGNANMTVDDGGIFYFVESDGSQVCLALASLANENEIGIIGNFQQKNQRIVYDTKKSKLGFGGEVCSFV